MKLVILAIVLALVLLETATALQCYLCDGTADSNCAKAVPSAMQLMECPSGGTQQCYATDFSIGRSRRFSRGCMELTKPDFCTLLYQMAAGNPGVLQAFSCELCVDNYCNTATTK